MIARKQAAKIINARKEFWFSGCQNPHTDIGVNLGSVHGLDELPEAFLVSVHLPVSTNEEFPAHGCVFCMCLLGIKTVPTAQQGTLRLG